MKSVLLLSVFMLLGFSPNLAQQKPTADQSKLEGTWKYISSEVTGKKAPEDSIKNGRIIFSKDKMRFKNGENLSSELTYKLDETKTPKWIEWSRKDEKTGAVQTTLAIYELTGDTLKICLNEFSIYGDKYRPAAFETKPTLQHIVLIVLKRESQ